jgi:hypothetical protein
MMTCRANQFWSQIHNAKPDDPRMVCFLLDSQSIADWLDADQSYEAVNRLLRPLPDAEDLLVATSASSHDPDGRGAEQAKGRTDEPGLFQWRLASAMIGAAAVPTRPEPMIERVANGEEDPQPQPGSGYRTP